MSKPKLIGTYELGVENVRLYLADGCGGATCRVVPNDNGCAMIILTSAQGDWGENVCCLMHEAIEMLMHRRGTGYYQTHTGRENTGAYLFVMSHAEFDQITEFASRLIVDCMGDLLKAWKMEQQKSKKNAGK